MDNKNIYIIGAGISGLVCALELEKAGYSPVILEKDSGPGGRVKTDLIDGVPLDHGFQVLLTAYPAAREYLDLEALDLKNFLPGAMINTNGDFRAFGDFLRNAKFFLPTLTSPAGSWKDKLGIFRLSQYVKSKSIDEIFSESQVSTDALLAKWGFTPSIVTNFFKPFFGGIFLEKELRTSSAMFQFIFKMFDSGFAAIPANGMQEIPGQLASKLKTTELRCNTRVTQMESNRISTDNGEIIRPRVTVLATAPGIFDPASGNDEPHWKSCNTYYFKTRKPLFRRAVIGLLADNSATVNSLHSVTDVLGTDPGFNVISATVVSAHDQDATQLLTHVKQDLASYCGIRDPELMRSYAVRFALPDLPKVKYKPDLETTRVSEGVYRTGDFLCNGSLNGAMESGRATAQAILEDLNSQ